MPDHTIAIISVYPENVTLLDTLLSQAGYETIVWTNPYSAYQMIRNEQPDLVLLDLWPKYPATGAMLLMLLHLDAATRTVPILACAAQTNVLHDTALPHAQPSLDVLIKPFVVDDICRIVQRLTESSQADTHAAIRQIMPTTERYNSENLLGRP